MISLDYDPDGRIAADEMGLVSREDGWTVYVKNQALWRTRSGDELGGNGTRLVQRVRSPEAVAEQWAELIRALAPDLVHRATAPILEP